MCYHFTISYFNTVYQNTKSLRAFYLLVQLGSDTACVCVAAAVRALPASITAVPGKACTRRLVPCSG